MEDIGTIKDTLSNLLGRYHTLEENGMYDEGCVDLLIVSFRKLAQTISILPEAETNDISAFIFLMIRKVQSLYTNNFTNILEATRSHKGGRSAPSYDISPEILEHLVEDLFCSIPEIADSFKVSESTVKRRMREAGLSIRATYSTIDDDVLDLYVHKINTMFPNSGIRTTAGLLLSGVLKDEGTNRPIILRIQRARIRDSLYRVDPLGMMLRIRRLRNVPRIAYNVFMPMALWHLDGNHKLIRYEGSPCEFKLPVYCLDSVFYRDIISR